MRSVVRAHPVLLLLTASGPALAAAQGVESVTARPTLRALPLAAEEVIRLDGVLDEPAWQRAETADGFLQREPDEGADPTEPTEVRIIYDRRALYIGVLLHDSNPDGIIGHQRRRDAGLGSDDRFMFLLDTFLDGRSGYFFEINPAGLMGDGLLQTGGGINKSWDGIWEARVARGAGGWSAEIAIPFRTLNFDQTRDTWGINFQRTVRRKNEETLWSGHRLNQGLFRPVHAGRLIGLENLSQGLGLEITPYVAGAWRRSAETGTETPADVGVDLTYSLTPSLRTAVTINTDFAETEVDRRRVNLTRFPLFFPEQRQFFLEGAGVYNFAPRNGVNPFFSRRIGLVEGEPTPITYGARLSGQAGPYEIGLLQIRTGEHDRRPAEHFTIGRVKRQILAQSTIGVIYTRRANDPAAAALGIPDGQTIGTDLDLFTSRFLGDRNLQFEAFYVVHTDPRGQRSSVRDRTSRGIRLNYPNDVWQMHVSLREFGNRWDPAVGFARRRGFRRLQPTIRYAPRPAGLAGVRRFEFEYYFERLTDLDGRLETRRIAATPFGIQFDSGDRLNLRVSSMVEHLDEGFEIHPTTFVPAGEYRFTQWTASARSASWRRVWGRAQVTGGEFWSGRRTEYEASVSVRPRAGVTVSADWAQNQVRLPEGTFVTRLVRTRASWHASPWTSLTANLQYDDVSRVTGLFMRYRWIVRPGSDVYVVYTHNWQSLDRDLVTLSRGATTKINYTHRF